MKHGRSLPSNAATPPWRMWNFLNVTNFLCSERSLTCYFYCILLDVFKILFLILIWRQISTMTVNAHGIVKCFDVFKNQFMCMCIIKDFKPVDPFSLQKCMERFYTGVIPWICFLWITVNHTFGCFLKCFRYVLASSVAVEDQRFFNISDMFCFFNTFHYVGCLQRLTQHPGNDFSWIQIHHTGKIHKSFKCPNISDIWTPDSIWMSRVGFLVDLLNFFF